MSPSTTWTRESEATWFRPAPGSPAFDFESFVDGANQALAESGYVGIPGPEGINTAIGDIMFGTIPFDSLAPEVQAGILKALDDSLTPGLPFNGWGMNMSERASRIGVRGREDLGGRLAAIYQVELEVELANADENVLDGDPNRISFRNTYVGLEGGWGRLLAGRHDTPLKMSTAPLDLFADTMADYNYTVGFSDLRPDNSILYMTPTLWGVQLAAAIIPAGGATALGIEDTRADAIAEGWSVAAVYNAAPFYASAGLEQFSSALWSRQNGLYDLSHGLLADDVGRWRLGLGLLGWHGIELSGIYESGGQAFGQPFDSDVQLWQVQAGYRLGSTRLKAMYGQASNGACADPLGLGYRFACEGGVVAANFGELLGNFTDQGDKSTWAIGLDHEFSRRSRVYALYTTVDDHNPDAGLERFLTGDASPLLSWTPRAVGGRPRIDPASQLTRSLSAGAQRQPKLAPNALI